MLRIVLSDNTIIKTRGVSLVGVFKGRSFDQPISIKPYGWKIVPLEFNKTALDKLMGKDIQYVYHETTMNKFVVTFIDKGVTKNTVISSGVKHKYLSLLGVKSS